MPCTAPTPGGATSMMIKVGVRDDHTAEARSARRPGRAAGAGTAFAGQPVTQTLNPPPPLFETCKTVGKRVICDGARTESYGPDDTGIACGSGAGAFDRSSQEQLAGDRAAAGRLTPAGQLLAGGTRRARPATP